MNLTASGQGLSWLQLSGVAVAFGGVLLLQPKERACGLRRILVAFDALLTLRGLIACIGLFFGTFLFLWPTLSPAGLLPLLAVGLCSSFGGLLCAWCAAAGRSIHADDE